jgi:hypothetical protein
MHLSRRQSAARRHRRYREWEPFCYKDGMCRSIKILRHSEVQATPEEVSAAALQFVRKVSGMHKPSRANQEAFDSAVRDVSLVVERLLDQLSKPGVARTLSSSRVGAPADA